MLVVLLFVHNMFHARGMLLILFQTLLVFFPQRLFALACEEEKALSIMS